MINDLLESIETIYIACGVTDFRKSTYSLCNLVERKFHLNPYCKAAFIFCNKKKAVLRFYAIIKMDLY